MCAEPLQFCAFGPCHHQDVCSACVARMRLVQKNMGCAICRKPCPQVFVTRYLDSHTRRVTDTAWEEMQVRACACGPSDCSVADTRVRRQCADELCGVVWLSATIVLDSFAVVGQCWETKCGNAHVVAASS